MSLGGLYLEGLTGGLFGAYVVAGLHVKNSAGRHFWLNMGIGNNTDINVFVIQIRLQCHSGSNLVLSLGKAANICK